MGDIKRTYDISLIVIISQKSQYWKSLNRAKSVATQKIKEKIKENIIRATITQIAMPCV